METRVFGPGPRDRKLNRIHELEGAAMAQGILRKVGYEPILTEEIVEIIRGHNSREDPFP